MLISTTNSGGGFDEVPFFIRFSADLVEAARERGITLYRESSHKLVESVIDLVLAENGDEEEEEEMDTQSANNSPDGPTSRASMRLVQESISAPISAGDVRMQRSQQKTARQSNSAPLPRAPILPTSMPLGLLIAQEQGLTMAQLNDVKKEVLATKEKLKVEQAKFNLKVKEVCPI
jgi:hypothetical protein